MTVGAASPRGGESQDLCGNHVDRMVATWFTAYMTTHRTAAQATEIAAWYTAKANEVAERAAKATGEVRKSLLRSAAQYRTTAANIERRGY